MEKQEAETCSTHGGLHFLGVAAAELPEFGSGSCRSCSLIPCVGGQQLILVCNCL